MWINIEQSDGTKYGDGPITTATSWVSRPRLDKPGKFSFRCPVGEAQAAEIVAKRHVHCYDIVNGAVAELGVGGIVDSIETIITGPGSPYLLVSGDDLLRDLRRHQVGDLELYDNAAAFSNPNEAWYYGAGNENDISMDAALDGNEGTHYEDKIYLHKSGAEILGDFIYVGHETKFNTIRLILAGQVNDNSSTLYGQYFSASGGWAAGGSFSDGTAAGGATFTATGNITFDQPSDWVPCTHAGVEQYWFRLYFDDGASTELDTVDFSEIYIYAQIGSTTPIADIMAYAPAGWSVEDEAAAANPEPTNLPLLKFGGESVLTALQKLAEDTGEHFRLGSGKTLVWIQATVASGIRAMGAHGGDSVSLDGNAAICLIESLRVTEDHYEVATRVYPYGAGRGIARVTLANATDTKAGYTIDTANNYIKVDTEAAGTREERVLSFPEVGTEYDDAVQSEGASNDLLTAAHEWLSRHIAAQSAYRVSVVKLDGAIEPGETIDVFYQEYRDGTCVVDIDATLNVLEATHEISAQGVRTSALYLGSIDAWPQSGGSAVANLSHRVARLEAGSDALSATRVRLLMETSGLEDTQFLTLVTSEGLTAERVLTPGDGLAGTDSGVGAAYTLDVDLVAAWSGLEISGAKLRVDLDAAFVWTGLHKFTNAINVGTATDAVLAGQIAALNAAVDTTASFYGIKGLFTKTAGATDAADAFAGVYASMVMDDADSTVSQVTGGLFAARLDAGTIDDKLQGVRVAVLGSAGTVTDVFGLDVDVRTDAAMTAVDANIYGIKLVVDADQDPAGDVYMLWLGELSNVDYGIYQDGSAQNYFGGPVNIGVTTKSSKLTTGLTLNMGGSDDEIAAFQSSDVAHGALTWGDTDSFGVGRKAESASGGFLLRGLKDADGANSQALVLQGLLAENVDTTKSTAGRALVELHAYQTNGDALANLVADGNAVAMMGWRGGALATLWILDEDGDTWQDGGATILGGVNVGTATDAAIAGQMSALNTAVETTATFTGVRGQFHKTAGVTDNADTFYGLWVEMQMNDADSTIGYLFGAYIEAELNAGTLGADVDLKAAYVLANLDAGTVTRDVYGLDVYVDIEAAMDALGGDVFGVRIFVDEDQGAVGTVYMLYLAENTGIDYGIYQDGSAPNRFGGPITLNGDLHFVVTGGLTFGEIYAVGAADTIAIGDAGKVNKVQITTFSVDGLSNNATPDHTNDHVTIVKAGMYLCVVSLHVETVGGGDPDTFGFSVYKNNGDTEFPNCHSHRRLAGGGADVGCVNISGLIDLAVNDTIELWVWNEDDAEDIVIQDVTMSLVMVGGT